MNLLERLQSMAPFWSRRAIPWTVKIAGDKITCEEFLGLMLEQAPLGIYTINREGIIDSFNPEMARIAGVKGAAEVIGLNALTLPTYKEVGLTEHFRAGLEGKAFELPAVKYTSFTGKKTTYRFYRGVPVIDKAGNVEKLALFVLDVTEKGELQNTLKELSAAQGELSRLAAVVENSFEGIIITKGCERDGCLFLYVNPAWERMAGWTREEVVGKLSPRILKSGKQDAAFYEKLWSTILAGETFHAELVNKRKDGSLYDAEVIIFPVKTADGNIMYAEISRNITERKQGEERARMHVEELERVNKILIDRELRMIELKKEVEELKKRLQS